MSNFVTPTEDKWASEEYSTGVKLDPSKLTTEYDAFEGKGIAEARFCHEILEIIPQKALITAA